MFPILLICCGLWLGCNKDAFLSAKPNSGIVVPSRLLELQALMDNEFIVNQTPLFGILSSDEYYLTDDRWQAQRPIVRNAYLWAADIYEGEFYATMNDWDFPYKQVLIANVVIDELDKMSDAEKAMESNHVRGAAMFLRAKALFALAEVFCMPYNESTASSDLGLPVKNSPDIEANVPRSSLADTYRQIVDDLNHASALLPDAGLSTNKLRPTKIGALALLARVHLAMRKYEDAGRYADSVLIRYDSLLDYNTVSTFTLSNPELIYHNIASPGIMVVAVQSADMEVDSALYQLYTDNDLRKTLFYREINGRVTMYRNYSALFNPFTGLAVDEIYLIRAEAYARDDRIEEAASLMNSLIENRYVTGSYKPIVFSNSKEALEFILIERRKELAFRGARWSDVRRLNLEGQEITMERFIQGKRWTLSPNDPRFALPIPRYEIDLSKLVDNPR